MSTLISKDKWSRADSIKLVEGLMTVTNVKDTTCLIVNDVYNIDVMPDNGHNLHGQKLTKIGGSTVTFSEPHSG